MPDPTSKPLIPGETVAELHAAVASAAGDLHALHAARLHCRRGCSACCVDDLSVFEVEADRIRQHHQELLANEAPHPRGACAFLDDAGACRIYEERPYVCRTQGLPLRWLEEDHGVTVELRDICPLNDLDAGLEPLESLAAEDCWTLGPVEDRLARIQLSISKNTQRTRLRDLFARRADQA